MAQMDGRVSAGTHRAAAALEPNRRALYICRRFDDWVSREQRRLRWAGTQIAPHHLDRPPEGLPTSTSSA
jgi:hypothetical protein